MSGASLPIIQSLWIKGELSVMEQLCLKSFLANGHAFHLYTYGDVRGVPEGVVLKNAEEILPADRIFVYSKEKSYAGFSNLFRYKLLLDRGNIWVDTDVVCLKPFQFSSDFILGRERARFPEPGGEWVYPNGIMGSPAHGDFIRQCYEEADSRDPEALHWGETGPELTTRLVVENHLHGQTQPPSVFDCLVWYRWYRAIHPKAWASFIFWYSYQLKGAHALHLYNEMWRRSGKDKNAGYPGHTVYERLKRRYAVVPPSVAF